LEAEGTSGKAIGSLVCGLLFVLFPAAIGAIVLGHMARGEIRRSGGRLKGGKLAIAGLVLGYAGVAAVPLALFMAILIPNIMYSRIEANETAAIGSLRTLNTAIMTYELTYGHYPASLAVLGPPDKLLDYEGRELPAKATPSEKGADVIEAVLAGGEKSGYKFSYHLDGKSDPKAYSVSADPINAPKTGRRFFLLDEFGVIHASDSGPATAASPPIQ
jgi:type II secretory pathway pseudopilin PulG